MMVGWIVEVCRRRGFKVNPGNSKVMIMKGDEGLECEVHKDGICLGHVFDFKYLECVLDKAGTYGTEFSRKVASGRSVACAIRSLVYAMDLQIECAIVLYETLLVPVLMNGSEAML